MSAIIDLEAGWTDLLVTGLAEWLDGKGLASWDETTPAADRTRPVFIGAVDDKPDLCVGLTPYGGQPDPQTAETVQPVQLWYRAAPGDDTSLANFADAVQDALHGLMQFRLGGIAVVLATLHNSVPMGLDDSGRPTRADNYQFFAMRPTPQRDD